MVETSVEAGQEPPLVIVVDDQSDARKLTRLSLQFENYRVVEAVNGVDALELIRRHHPDAVLLDILMPGPVDGYDVCRQIKSDARLKETAVILVSAMRGDEQRELGRDCGADAYLAKPFSFTELTEALETHLRPSARG
ncbi:MAG: response regulator [Betaproteobacteria bacterium]|nr:response regulator [Betaproteobacteria bacterium]